MDEDVRMATNRQGFCEAHLQKLYAGQNRLGLASMLQTYMQRLNKDADAAGMKLAGLFEKEGKDCYVCGKVAGTFARYMDTFFTLWAGDKEAAKLIADVRGYCLPHFSAMIKTAETRLSKGKLAAFIEIVLPAQREYMRQIEEDLTWFVMKFDYRNADAPWKNAKDALPRAMAMLHGQTKEG
jgi:hypothetical protein